MRVRVLYHDHCFDGAASAAYFSRFYEGKYAPGADFEFTGLAHKASQLFEDGLFDGDVNAIVDFKYSPNPRLTWWFDHHQSAFLSPEDAEHFRQDHSGHKLYDPSYSSCTMFIADVARERFGFDAPDLAELVQWADIIDGARYANAQEAVELKAPAMQLTLVIEGAKGSEIIHKIIGWMRHCKLGEIVQQPEIQQLYAPLYERHLRSIDLIKQRAADRRRRGVLRFDWGRSGRLQQVHPLLPVPGLDLHGVGEHVQLPDQGFGGIESLGEGAREAQPGHHLRALRRRRASARGRHQLRDRRDGKSPRGG